MANKKKFFDQGSAGVVNTENFGILTYTGNNATGRSFTGLGFEPALIWNKQRNGTTAHILTDTVRGLSKSLSSNSTNAEFSQSYYTSFDSDGWTFNNSALNSNNETFVNWCWKAGGTAVSNTDGANLTSTVSANPEAGFSIIKYTGDGNSSSTFGHGLNQTPDLYIHKDINNDGNDPLWGVYHVPTDKKLFLNLTNGGADATSGGNNGILGTNKATSTTLGFNAGSSSVNNVNSSGADYLVYAFHNVDGYQSVGSYTGNGSATGPIVTTGFEPRFLVIKRTDTSGYGWYMMDSTRGMDGTSGKFLFANTNNDEGTLGAGGLQPNSNGFQIKDSGAGFNANGGTYIYLAIA